MYGHLTKSSLVTPRGRKLYFHSLLLTLWHIFDIWPMAQEERWWSLQSGKGTSSGKHEWTQWTSLTAVDEIWPYGCTRWEVRGAIKIIGTIIWVPWISHFGVIWNWCQDSILLWTKVLDIQIELSQSIFSEPIITITLPHWALQSLQFTASSVLRHSIWVRKNSRGKPPPPPCISSNWC